ncbi:MAG: protein phosphatase 2C domain-containing protein, partial [Chloroflexi bacterium]|nr:protein phosphatase 2C domain-containing protein [Chloroflexota bacterium]
MKGTNMGNEQPQPQWRAAQWCAIGQSVRGAAHVRGDLPDQDAIRWLPASGLGAPLILAVSDGHGSPRYFRSHVGADLAVETAVWVIQDLLDGQPDPANLTAIKRTAEDRLPREIVAREVRMVERLGVDIQTGVRLGRDFTLADLRDRGYDAVFL